MCEALNEPVAELVSWPDDRTPMAWIGDVNFPEGTKAYLHPQAAWQPIETAPTDSRRMFVAIATGVQLYPSSRSTYTSDPWCVWREQDGSFARWPHGFAPTHWMPIPGLPEENQNA